jgi:hypothetical protein
LEIKKPWHLQDAGQIVITYCFPAPFSFNIAADVCGNWT